MPALVIRCSRERAAFSKGGVPFPLSRWRFYNIHPTCTHVWMVILVPASPPSFSIPMSENTLATIEISNSEKDRVFRLVIARGYCLLSCFVRFSKTRQNEISPGRILSMGFRLPMFSKQLR